jgi:hypothetical protein
LFHLQWDQWHFQGKQAIMTADEKYTFIAYTITWWIQCYHRLLLCQGRQDWWSWRPFCSNICTTWLKLYTNEIHHFTTIVFTACQWIYLETSLNNYLYNQHVHFGVKNNPSPLKPPFLRWVSIKLVQLRHKITSSIYCC